VSQQADGFAIGQGYYFSIVLMIAVPFGLAAFFARGVVKSVRAAKQRDGAPTPPPATPGRSSGASVQGSSSEAFPASDVFRLQ
jgi:hypothetical protein